MSLLTYLCIAAGGAVGATLRYLTTTQIQSHFLKFPAGTLVCNVLGSFILGLVLFGAQSTHPNKELIAFLSMGVLGSYTTLSTFSYETFSLFSDQHGLLAFTNIAVTLILSISAILFARFLVSTFLGGSIV